MKFSIKNFFSKCDQILSFLRSWSHLLKKSLMKNFIFFVVLFGLILVLGYISVLEIYLTINGNEKLFHDKISFANVLHQNINHSMVFVAHNEGSHKLNAFVFRFTVNHLLSTLFLELRSFLEPI